MPTPIRVAHVLHEYCPSISEFIARIATNPETDNSVFCAFRSNSEIYPHANLQTYKWSFVAGKLLGRRAFDFVRERQWQMFISSRRPQILHVQFGTTLVEHLDLLKRSSIPAVATFHGSDINTATYNRDYFRSLQNAFARLDRGIFVSESLRNHAVQLGFPESKAVVVRVGTNIPDLQSPTRRPVAAKKVICCVARLTACKGHETLIRAFALVRINFENVRLRIVGNGRLLHRLSWLAKHLRVDDHIDFLGEISHRDALSEIQNADIIALTSQVDDNGQAEGVPVTLMEAAAHCVAVVATRCGGISELVRDGETGLLCESRDINGIAEAMIRLLTDDEIRLSMGNAARKVVHDEFNAKRSSRQLASLYRELVVD